MTFKMFASSLFIGALGCLAATSALANRTLILNAVTNECGGTLYASGTGWGEGPNTLTLTATGVPGSHGHTENIGVAASDHDKFSSSFGWSYPPGSPNCLATNAYITVTATGQHGNKVSSEVEVPSGCTIVWSACPA